MKYELISDVAESLLSSGYQVLICEKIHSSFDIFAKKEDILLIKVLSNIEGFTKKNADELKQVAKAISAVPVVIGKRMKHTNLTRGVIYSRYNTNVCSAETLSDILEDSLPVIFSVRGDYCIGINSKMMVKIRKRLQISQQRMADALGVSKQSIYRYEHSGSISIEIAKRLIECLDSEDIIIPKDIFSEKHEPKGFVDDATGFKKIIINELRGIGMNAVSTKAPFDIVAGNKEIVLTVIGNNKKYIIRRMEMVDRISEIMDAYEVCISDTNPDIDPDIDVVIINPCELAEIKNHEEFMRRITG